MQDIINKLKKFAEENLGPDGPKAWQDKNIGKVWQNVYLFAELFIKYDLPRSSASITYYTILAIFPLLMAVLSFAGRFLSGLPETEGFLPYILNIMPVAVQGVISDMIEEAGKRNDFIRLLPGAVLTLWTAAKGFATMIKVIREIYPEAEERKFNLPAKVLGIITVAVLIAAICFSAVIFSFSTRLHYILVDHFNFSGFDSDAVNLLTTAIAFMILFVSISVVYYIGSKSSGIKIRIIPGSLFAGTGWLLLTFLYTYYVKNSRRVNILYGSLTTTIILLLWINFCVMFILCGAIINRMVSYDLPKRKEELKEKNDNEDKK